MSYIQDYIEYIIEKHETLTTVPHIHFYIHRINDRLVFKVKDGLQTIVWNNEIIWWHKKLIEKTKIGENVHSLEVGEVVLVQCNLVDNQYPQKWHNFTPKKSYAYLLNVEPSNLVFLKTYNTEFDETIKTFSDQNGRPLEIDNKVNLIMFNNK